MQPEIFSEESYTVLNWHDWIFIFGLAIPLHSFLIMVMFLNLVYFFSSALKKRLKKPRPPYFSADPSSVVCEELSWPVVCLMSVLGDVDYTSTA